MSRRIFTEEEEYIMKLAVLNIQQLRKECSQFKWLTEYVSNKPRSRFHWMCAAMYNECVRRGRIDIYNEAYRKLN